MILFPAIDLKGGACVRLVQGDMARATVFSDDPPAQARAFEAAGFAWLHIVDLDGAFAGKPVNADAVGAILEAVDLPVQLGGGIRDMATIEAWLARGVRRVILGTVAVRDPDLVRDACRAFPGRVAVGIDARDGRVAVEGWAETVDMEALELARRFEDAGLPRSSTPTSRATGRWRASPRRRPGRWRGRWRRRSSPPAASPPTPTSKRSRPTRRTVSAA